MSNMQCYRGDVYAITNISTFGKRNHIGVINGESQPNSQSHEKWEFFRTENDLIIIL
jgi:hypothetical protein